MRRLLRAGCLVAALAGCAGTGGGAVDYAQVSPGAFGPNTGSASAGNVDAAAALVAENAFGDAGRTYGRPADGARAAAALEYMAGAAYAGSRWQSVSGATKDELAAARAELRTVLGVRPGVRSQGVVDGLLAAAAALDGGGNEGAAAAALDRSGVFTVPGAEVVNRLANLPYLRDANLATQHAADELQANDTEFRHF